ncbi:hypothetical protein [Natrinema versiforme]|uniref:Uncharacterized protein n=1 Tax=Natrinema versiforme TaxID=88724 RepID=A0A4P8WJG9_9EURY|nr:hypothetical protein [Natrinema versiforme]QCS43627.1 hypothetical protein FEJ81_15180 [Natrinema versiforme]
MNTEFWISELGRLYERSTEAIDNEQSDAIEPLADEFNETLSQLKEEFPDNPIVTSTDPVEAYTEGTSGKMAGMDAYAPPRRRDEALHEIRSRCEKMANAIGFELPELETGSRSPNRMVMVSVDSRQETTQEVHQDVTVESIQNMIQTLPRATEEKEELQELLGEFRAEVEGEQDEPRLRQILSKANEISSDVATQMAVLGLTHGATSVLGL